MRDAVSLAGIALCALTAVLTVRETRREFVPYLLLGTSALLLGACLPGVGEAVTFAKTLAALVGDAPVTAVLRALGIAWMTSAAAEMCRGAGEAQIAGWVETAGKVELAVLSLPFLRDLLAAAGFSA